MRVLDVGCGPGTITRDLAPLVTPADVVGVDASADVVAEARELGAEGVHFQTGDVYRLQFGDGTFDVVHAHQVLQHLTRPVDALREMRRVMSADGLVAARDSAYGMFRWYPHSPALEEWQRLYFAVTQRNDAQADAGLYLKAWAREAGFTDVVTSSSTWTFEDPETRAWWADSWAERATRSSFAEQAVAYGLADRTVLDRIAQGWRDWATHPDGLLIIVHGEVIARG